MVSALGSIALGMVVVLFITALTGYFVAQEFAFIAVDRSRLKARANAGDSTASRALTVTRRTSFMLSGAQLGITVTGLLVGFIADPLIGGGFAQLVGTAVPAGLGVAVGAVLAVSFSTVVQMVFGELFPKNLAIARPEPVAGALAVSTSLYLKLFGWLIWLFDQSSNLLLRALRIEPVHDVEHSATARDLVHIVADSRDAGELPRELSTLLDRVLDFPTRNAGHAMIPRPRVDVVTATEPVGAVVGRMATGHTRYPVIGATPDDLVGVVHLHDLLGVSEDADQTLDGYVRPAVVVPETMALPEVMRHLAAGRDEMALVVDEYGGFAGVVTVEDLAEELVGEIADEHDITPGATAEADGDGWSMPGDLALDEAARAIGRPLPQGDYETVAGMVIAVSGGLPQVGDEVRVELPADPAGLVDDAPAPPEVLTARVLGVARRVPSSVFLSVSTEGDR